MYGKIFESMFDGTLASKGPWQALVTFQQMIVLADQDGVVDMTAHAISRRTSIPLEIIEVGIRELMEPDEESRTPTDEGRRIALLEEHRSWGWRIVNHAKYRDMRKAEDRREYLRNAQAKKRAVDRQQVSTPVNTCPSNVNTSTHTETDAEAEADTTTSLRSVVRAKRGSRKCPVEFAVTDAMQQWAATDAPRASLQRETAKFMDYTFKSAMTDWAGAWRNWMRKASDSARGSAQSESFRERDERIAREKYEVAIGKRRSTATELVDEVPHVAARRLG